MERKVRKQNAPSIKTKMELLQAVSEANLSKIEICKKSSIPNFTLPIIVNNRVKIVKNYESSKFEPDRGWRTMNT
jgi:hypothetical protein